MKKQKKIRDFGITIGKMHTGKNNSITDVPGIKVGHFTLNDENIKTGVTAIIPHKGNMYKEKLVAASHVINGFGKTMGLIQVDELGCIETPIILTNTLSVGAAHEGLVKYMLSLDKDIQSLNPIICECNDGYLNDIRGLHIKSNHVIEAIENASSQFLEGSIGAGTGMKAFGLKGGIGSASRVVFLDNKEYILAVLVLSNFGRLEDFIIDGKNIGQEMKENISAKEQEEKGSIISIVATNIPLSSRQLKRVIKRVGPGIARTGGFIGHGSGEITLGFSTGNILYHKEEKDIINIKTFNESKINQIFRATTEATEEAILNSMITANTTVGKDGHIVYSLKDFM